MSWIIGIDEAGYGPNLGPFVMTAIALRVPDDGAEGDLWQRLAAAVRRQSDPDDGRLLVADSKVVYAPARGLPTWKRACSQPAGPRRPMAISGLADYLDGHFPSSAADLRRECWSPRKHPAARRGGAGTGCRSRTACGGLSRRRRGLRPGPKVVTLSARSSTRRRAVRLEGGRVAARTGGTGPGLLGPGRG